MVDQSTQALRKGLALAMACDHPDEIADWDINAIRDTLADAGLAIVPVEPTEAMMAPVHKLKMLNSKEIFLCGEDVRNCGIWQAMLRAAQKPEDST